MSAEATVEEIFIWMVELLCQIKQKYPDLVNAQKILDEDHYLEKVKRE